MIRNARIHLINLSNSTGMPKLAETARYHVLSIVIKPCETIAC